jgi:exodeoxyribonuclease V alpha subunit
MNHDPDTEQAILPEQINYSEENTLNNLDELSQEKKHILIVGQVIHIIYRAPDSGFTVFKAQVSEQGGNPETIIVTGATFDLHNEDEFNGHGEYTNHKKFGRQFKAFLIEKKIPSDLDQLKVYLSSGIIKGIGPKLANDIVDHFGEKCHDILRQEPDRLHEVNGIGKQKAETLARAFTEGNSLKKIAQFLIGHRISPFLATRILALYGIKALEKLRANPYLLAKDLKGVGFKKADQIALRSFGISTDSPLRLKAAIIYALELSSHNDGHVYLTTQQLFEECQKLLSDVPIQEVIVQRLLAELNNDGTIIQCDNERVYLQHLYNAEKHIENFIQLRIINNRETDTLLMKDLDIESIIKESGQLLQITYTDEQQESILLALKKNLSIITGGPGCGKTTLIKALVTILGRLNNKVILCAPTGRAANRLQTVTAHEASTIHRVLKWRDGAFFHDAKEPLDTDFIIVDECSMVDVVLMADLMRAIPTHARLVLVGDKDQLPSVGPGRVFGDLIDSQVVPFKKLKVIHRRSAESSINTIAHTINIGHVPLIPQPDGKNRYQAYFIQRSLQDNICLLIEKLISSQLYDKFGYSLNDILLLTPTNKGPLGTESLNKRLQAVLNPPSDDNPTLKFGERGFRCGDRVCQRKNNYNLDDQGVFNGDTGVIETINIEKNSLFVRLWDQRLVEYNYEVLSQLAHAYCLTIHRAQGSEAPCVILILHQAHKILLERQLIYTAVTRAKEALIIIGTTDALQIACARSRGVLRNSGLSNFEIYSNSQKNGCFEILRNF